MKSTLLISALTVLFLGSQAWAQGPDVSKMTRDTSKGKVLVDGRGMTLYTFDKDAGGKSTCNGTCAQNWPPMSAGTSPVNIGDWTAVTRDDGRKMWAYRGKPLYTFINDKAPGDVNGDGANGGTWHIAQP